MYSHIHINILCINVDMVYRLDGLCCWFGDFLSIIALCSKRLTSMSQGVCCHASPSTCTGKVDDKEIVI